MSSTNLTREEARRRAEMLQVQRYEIALDLTRHAESDTFESVTTVAFTVQQPGDTFIDLRAAGVNEVRLNGVDIRRQACLPGKEGVYDETRGIQLPKLSTGEHRLQVVAQCRYSHSGQGLHRFVDPADQRTYLYTQFETADAKRVFACFDQPDLKARYRLTVHTPEDWRVISNAPQETHTTADGTLTHTSEVDYPLSTYLIAVCAGPYLEVKDTWTGTLTHHPETPTDQPHDAVEVPLGLYCRQSIGKHLDPDVLFRETKQGFDYYHRHFGFSYPFNKYDQVFCPEYNMGAMENAGCVTIRDEYVFTSAATHYRYERRADTILHELAHMWFGDLVTMRWWDDLWLNESFATWASAMSQSEETEYTTAWVTFANVEKAWAYQQDQLPSTHPVFSGAQDIEEVEQNFDGITYAKGASVLKQLQAYVGREAFFAGVRRHFAAHAYGNATFADLLAALEDASGRDLSGWADEWLRTTGISEIRPEFEVAKDGTYSRFTVVQTETPRTHRLAVGLYSLVDGRVVRTERVELDVSGHRTEVPQLVGLPNADLVIVNDDDLTYCMMGLDNASLHFLMGHIQQIEDPMTRTLCWSAAWELTRAGTIRPRDFVALVARGAAAETELAVLESVLAKATTALRRYADPGWAHDEGADLLVGALLEGARSEDAERALICARALCSLPLIPASVTWARKVLAGEAGRLTMDNDLRWLALTALIAAGEFSSHAAEDAISDQLTRDPSARGEQSALRARAALPRKDVKRETWRELFDADAGLSNLAIRWKMEGLTFGYAEPALSGLWEDYFTQSPGVWERFDSELAQSILLGTYPRWEVTQAHIDRADALLAEDLPAGLRRILVENRDRTARALRLRQRDRS